MKVTLSFNPPADTETELLAVVVLDESEKGDKDPKPKLASADKALEAAASDLLASGEVTGKSGESVLLHKPHGFKAKRLLLIGGGKARSFNAHEARKAAGAAVRFLKTKNLKKGSLVLPGGAEVLESARAAVEGAYIADYDPDTYKSDRKDQRLDEFTLVVAPGYNEQVKRAVDVGRIIAESQNYTRELVNEPGNRLTPMMLADRAKQMASEVGVKCEIYSTDKLKALKMGAFLSVAQGSDEPPALIVLTYEPQGAPKDPVLGLVGKGITFDTGGISIKPAESMEKMKYDMAGGAAMLGAMRAIALLKPKVKVICIVCASENMPSGKAQKPGDVQFAMNGKSIEVINTDAEGRLVLADGLHYARQLGATHLVDAATLTGACVVALGYHNAGVFANNDEMYSQFENARHRAGEKMWRLPMDSEYFDQIKSNIADIQNVGGRWGGAITAAKFLEQFVEDTPWIHLDIAGVAWIEDGKAWIPKGPSGVAVRTLVEFARELAGEDGTGPGGGKIGFTGGAHQTSQPGTQEAKKRSDSGAGL
jgi:leucyl aminopeptidase